MNSNAKLDAHMEAESLNAFLEGELPAREREQVLSHIASCSRCREILFLAQEAAAAESTAAAPTLGVQTKPASWWKRDRWFPKGRLVWIAAVACTGCAGIAILFVALRTPKAPDTAKVQQFREEPTASIGAVTPAARTAERPAGLPDEPARSESRSRSTPAVPLAKSREAAALPEKPSATSSQRDVPQASAQEAQLARGLKSGLPNAAAQERVAEAKVEQSVPKPTSQVTFFAANSVGLSQDAPVTVNLTPAPLNTLRLQGKNVAANKPTVSAARFRGVSSASATGQVQQATVSGASTGASPAAPSRVSSFTSGSANFAAHALTGNKAFLLKQTQPTDDAVAARNALYSALPNGLTAISTAAEQHHLLALDPKGSLFLSEDYGKTWHNLPPQWSGRALEVRTLKTQTLQPQQALQGNQPAITVSPGAPLAVEPVFEMVTDSVSVWTSVDGRTWKRK